MTNVMTRKFGVEMEGYFPCNPRGLTCSGGVLKMDGSLRHCDWSEAYHDFYGVEVNSNPTNDIEDINRLFGWMKGQGFFTDERAGTHIHVSIEDYTEVDKAKALTFLSSIQDAVYPFVKNNRYSSGYCKPLGKSWSSFFEHFAPEDIERASQKRQMNGQTADLISVLYYDFEVWGNDYFADKYYWFNAFTRYKTVEFRLFHAIEDVADVQNFIKLSVGLVDLIKNSTVEQLKFLTSNIKSKATAGEMMQAVCEAAGLDFTLPVKGDYSLGKLVEKITPLYQVRQTV